LDPKVNPDMAARQWRLLVSQLQMLSEATGPALLASQLETHEPQTELCRRVLTAVQPAAQTTSSLP
jgi:hypothetical protein